jgi:hypothetical protein
MWSSEFAPSILILSRLPVKALQRIITAGIFQCNPIQSAILRDLIGQTFTRKMPTV